MEIIANNIGERSLGTKLNEYLLTRDPAYSSFRAAIAYVKQSGMQHVINSIGAFLRNGCSIELIIGIDQYGTSIEGLTPLLALSREYPSLRLFINHDENPYVTFHPKIYCFENNDVLIALIGSPNLTEGGMYSNDECFIEIKLQKSSPNDNEVIRQINEALNHWRNEEAGNALLLTNELFTQLTENGYIRIETRLPYEPVDEEQTAQGINAPGPIRTRLFRRLPRRRPPRAQHPATTITPREEREQEADLHDTTEGFIMTLMRTDVGTGQTTPGTSRRSPEIFIPLSARDNNPEFWGWPNTFSEDNRMPGKYDRSNVRMFINGETVNVSMMTWPAKHDFRLRCEALRSAGSEGDIIRIERVVNPIDYEYYVTIIPQNTIDYRIFRPLCNRQTPHSERMWGYYAT